jgi:conjugal transfer pilus assembly protein TraW
MRQVWTWLWLLVAAGPALAQPAPAIDDLETIGAAAAILRKQGGASPVLRDLADQAGSIVQGQLPQSRPLAMPHERQLILFVSASLGDEALKRAFRAASGDPEITIVFRGVLPGETLTRVVRRLGELLEGIEPKPNVAIHPKSFRDHRVSLVPTIVEQASGRTIRGTLLAETFRKRADGATDLDLGVVGPVRDIAEPDLVALIKAEIAQADIEADAMEAVSSYWRRVSFIELPKASKHRVRRLDPTVTTENELRVHEGRLLAPAGVAINPLERLPFASRLLVFDGTDPDELAWAKEHVHPERKTILITAKIDREVGWPAWKRLHDDLGQPVYLLPAKLAERLAIEATPTLIEASPDGQALLITEDAPGSREGGS